MVYDPVALHERQQIGEPDKNHESVIDQFDSLEEFLRHLKTTEHDFREEVMQQLRLRKSELSSEYNIDQMFKNQSMRRNLHFNMCHSFADAMKLAEYGWPEGRDRVAQKEAEIRNIMRDMIEAPSFFHDHIGEEVDVAEYLQGTPEHMIGYDVTQTRHKFLRITVDVNCRCDACGRRAHDAKPNPPEWAMIRGAVVSLLVQALLRYGFQVEVVVGAVAFHAARDNWALANRRDSRQLGTGYKHTTLVTIHRPGWLFDFDRIVFCTAHEGFTRKLLFRHEEAWIIDKLGGWPWMITHWGDPPMVGRVDQYAADRPRAMPEMGESDIHLDSYPVMVNRLQHEQSLSRKNAYAAANDTFANVTAGARWLLDRLKGVGITFR